MWKLTKIAESSVIQDLRIMAEVRDLCEYSPAENATSFDFYFQQMLKKIPRSNNFSADLLYKVTQRNLYSVEVWKMFANGDFKYKMAILDYIQE